jgi:Holliday junction resolvasome RuvABC endonuclease subunit
LFFQENPNMAVYMEMPLVGRSAHSTIVQAQVGGAVLAAADNAGVDFHLVNVNTWKKQVVGKGNAKKEDVAEWLRDNWPDAYTLCGGDQDLVDASALNRYGFRHERIRQAILQRINRARKNKEEVIRS